MTGNNQDQTIEQLQQRYTALMAQKVKFETQRDAAADELAALKKEAMEQFKCDDIAELEKMLAKMKADNEQQTRQYQASLDNIDQNLAAVQESFDSAETES